MEARFIKNLANVRLIRNAIQRNDGKNHEYVVERVVYLSLTNFIYFREHLLESDPNIKMYNNDMFTDENNVWHVLMFCCIQSDVLILVYSNGEDCAKYVSIISNGGEKVEPRFTTGQRYTRRPKTKCRRTTAIK